MRIRVKTQVGEVIRDMEMNDISASNEKEIIGGFFELMGVGEAAQKDVVYSPNIAFNTTDKVDAQQLTRVLGERMKDELQKKEPGVNSPGVKVTTGPTRPPSPPNQKEADKALDDMIEKSLGKPSVSRRLPIIGHSERTKFPVEETAKVKSTTSEVKKENSIEGDPGHWATGIKVDDDGTKKYRCHYWCNCGNKGKRYIPLDFDFIYCHSCGADIDVELATGKTQFDGIPERDGFGNFFIGKN